MSLGTNPTNGVHANGESIPLKAALAYLRGGLSVIPVRRDGSKAPAVSEWSPYREERASEEQARRWWDRPDPPGVAVICGRASGYLERIDFDVDAESLFTDWRDLVEAEQPGLVVKLSISKTPRPGFQVGYRCNATISGNCKLAVKPSVNPSTGHPETITLIETRGEGGYALVPGCPAECHETGRLYEHFSGPPLSQVTTITADEREILIRCARSFDQRRDETVKQGSAGRPGDDFNHQRGWPWDKILVGWKLVFEKNGKCHWARPGKEKGWSATTGYCTSKAGDCELLAVFSSNAHPFPGPSNGRNCSVHSKFDAYAKLHHSGDFKAAARELGRLGFGDQTRKATARASKPAEADDGETSDVGNSTAACPTFQRGDAWEPDGADRASPTERKSTATADLISLATVERQPVQFLWHRRLIRGGINLLDGDPGLGKSFIALDVAARLSSGRAMPEDQVSHKPANVLLLSHEDDLGRTIKPRLEDLGADIARIFALGDVLINGSEPRQFTLPLDCDLLEEKITDYKIELAIFDPLFAFFDGKYDSHNDAHVRQVLHPLKKLAERTGVCILAIRHLNKLINVENAMYRGGGSIAVIGMARSALLVAPDHEDPMRRMLGRIKGNLSAEPTTLAYSIRADQEGHNPVVEWQGPIETTIGEFLARGKVKEKESVEKKKVDEAGTKILTALDEHDPAKKGVTEKSLRVWTRLNRSRLFGYALEDLLKQQILETVPFEYECGRNSQRTTEGIRRKVVSPSDSLYANADGSEKTVSSEEEIPQ